MGFWTGLTGSDNLIKGWLVFGFVFEAYLKVAGILYVIKPELFTKDLFSVTDLEVFNVTLTLLIFSSKI